MNKKNFILICLYCLFCELHIISAIHKITYERNMFRANDVIVKQQIEYIDPGLGGASIIWDFSKLFSVNDKYTLNYYVKDASKTNSINSFEHGTYYNYWIDGDTLWLIEYSNRKVFMSYQQPEMIMKFPISYGDTISSTFSGKGKYCQTIDLCAEGKISIFADAYGKIITPERDTLHNILRINRKKEYLNVGTDSSLIVLQSYQWYRKGERYPVYETVKSTTFCRDSIINDFSASFYLSATCKENLPFDPANLEVDDLSTLPEIINCEIYPNPVRTQLKIRYELNQKAHISFIISDISGKPWIFIPESQKMEGFHEQFILMNGYPIGEYVINIVVNGKIFRYTILKY